MPVSLVLKKESEPNFFDCSFAAVGSLCFLLFFVPGEDPVQQVNYKTHREHRK